MSAEAVVRAAALREAVGPLLPTAYHLLWAAIPLLVLVAAVVAVIAVVRRAGRTRRSVPGSKSERLAELDELLATGAISAAEHADARAAVLRS